MEINKIGIDKIFFNYNIKEIQNSKPDYFINFLKSINGHDITKIYSLMTDDHVFFDA
jgi:ketosteroid isomerase-like protein